MNMIYNSPHFCVVEFSDFSEHERHASGGYEIMDKGQRREIYLAGVQAEQFRLSVQELISGEPSYEDVDDFLAGFSGLMTQPVMLH